MRRRILKIIGYFILSIVVILAILAFSIQTSTVQNYISDAIFTKLSKQYNADWSVEDLKIEFMDEVIIKGIVLKDQKGDTLLAAKSIMVDIGLVNLLGQEIRLDQIDIEGATSHIYDQDGKMNFDFLLPKENTGNTSKSEDESESWDISIGKVNLASPKILVETGGQVIDIKTKTLKADFTSTDFANNVIQVSNLSLGGAQVDYTPSAIPTESSNFEFPDLGWNIAIASIDIEDSRIGYEGGENPIQISQLNVDIEDVKIDEKDIRADVNRLNLLFNNEIKLSDLKAEIVLIEDVVSLDNLAIKTDDDELKSKNINYNINTQAISGGALDIDIDYQTLSKLKKYLPTKLNLAENANLNTKISSFSFAEGIVNASGLNSKYGDVVSASGNFKLALNADPNMYLDSNIDKLSINLQKASKLWQGFSIPDSLKQYKNLTLSGDIEGYVDNFKINTLDLDLDDVLAFKASGSVSNITDIDQLDFDLNIDRLSANVPRLPIPTNENIALDSLGFLVYSGKVSGNLEKLKVAGSLDSELGSLQADLTLNIPKDIGNISYKGDLSLDKFDVGTLLKNDQLDVVSIKLKLDGKGLDFNKLNSKIDGVISDFVYNDYRYSDIKINASISDRTINGKFNINDANAKLSYNGVVKLDSATTILDFTALIDTLNLKALGFMENLVTLSGEIDSEIRLPLRKGEQGKIDILNLVLANETDSFHDDSIAISAKKYMDSTFVSMDADFAQINIEGKYGIRDIPASIGDLVDYYINLDTSFVHFQNRGESLKTKGQIRTLAPFNILMPDMFLQAGIIDFDANLDFINKKVNGVIVADSFFVSKFFSEKLALNINSESNDIFADISGENNSISGTEIPILSIQNVFSRQRLSSTFEAKDDDKLPRLRFSIDTEFEDGFTQFALSDSLILNKKDWLASVGNSVKVYPDKLVVDNLTLTDNNEYLTMSSTDTEGNGLNIDFKNFNIGQFTTLMTSQPSKLEGNINGTIDLLDLNDDPYYLVNLKIEDLIYDSTSVGTLSVEAKDNQSTGILNTDISLIGPEYDVHGGGKYNTNTTALDFDLDINAFQMMLIDPFVSEILKESEGKVTGKITLDGTADQPIIDGALTLHDVVTTIVVNNARYGVEKQTVTFDNNSIDIGVLDLFDAKNNVATLSGKIYHSYLQDMRLDMNLTTDEFTFLNTSADDNPVFFGKMVLGADVGLSGPLDLLDVQVVAKTLDSTEVNISPFSIEKFLLEEDFITYGKPSDFEDLTNEYLLKLARQFPFKVNIILDATAEAKMNFVVDPITGDKIEGRGKGNLRIKLNPDGQQEIFGTYTITDGAYTFSYGDFVSKNFSVKPGGTVKFNGDPLNAILDINAIYSVYTTTYELIKNEISANDNEVAAAKRRTKVDVYLSMQGTLDEPLIKLDIKLPDLESAGLVSTTDRKLSELRSNPNELNNQVFGLLIFNSFILSDNLASGFGNLGSNIALSSVSSLISNQLNKLADKVIKGVDVDINVNSYDSNYANDGAGGTVTEVGLKVSKQLFNDRLSISAGGNFDLSGQTNEQSYSSLIGDFVLEYKLTESGRYRVRVFSKSDYDRLLNQNTNKNGVSLFFNRSFDSKLDD